MKRFSLALLLVLLVACNNTEIDYEKLNAQAAEEYNTAIRPGYEGRNPYWNEFAVKFIYAPAFDFKEVEGAAYYQYTVTPKDNAEQKSWVMTAQKPNTSLSPIWQDIEVGQVVLKVEAMNDEGKAIATVGEREFLRDFPFEGPYHKAVRDYKECAILGLLAWHNKGAIQSWKHSVEPDMSYDHNTYACKIIGSTVRCEVLLAQLCPSLKDDALKIAENAMQFLINQSQPADAPLAYFPPTYYLDYVASRHADNIGKTMTFEPLIVAHALLELYNITDKKEYLDRAMNITDTYTRLQAEDGSFPIKIDYQTGEPVNEVKASLDPLLWYLLRLESEYGITKYKDMRSKAEQWMQEVAVEKFDLTGQFEDVSVLGLRPYENLTNCTFASYGTYLLAKETTSDKEMQDALDMIRFSEDQFVCWDYLPNQHGVRIYFAPCVLEQYKYRTPIDYSACNMAEAWLYLYKHTGNELHLSKAKAMIDNITIMQNISTGMLPTLWCVRGSTDWINCSHRSIDMLLQMDKLLKE